MGLPVSSSSSSSTLAVVVLLLVLVSAPKAALAVSPFQSYMVDPPSSLDVVYAPSASAAHSSGGKQQAAGPSALQQQQRDIDAVRTRMLQQAAPANPQRLLPPYNVCVSSWAPMVRCTPDSAQEDFQGVGAGRCGTRMRLRETADCLSVHAVSLEAVVTAAWSLFSVEQLPLLSGRVCEGMELAVSQLPIVKQATQLSVTHSMHDAASAACLQLYQ